MPLPQVIDADVLGRGSTERDAAFCSFIDRWAIDGELGQRLVQMASRLEFGISIISGARSPQRQNELRAEGLLVADNDRSTHVAPCPATGADLRPSVAPVNAVKARFGAEAVFAGLRWGGGSPVDPQTGIPSDWNHVDLGPVPM